MINAESWVAIALILFVALLGYFGVHRRIFEALDKRSARVKLELDQARRLRQEAEDVLAESSRKYREVEIEARLIMEGAHAEAKQLTVTAKAKNDEFVARRIRSAEIKIAQAELQALAEVKAFAADAAVAATKELLTTAITDGVAARLVARDIELLQSNFRDDAR